jgi:hypothetical protein
LRLGEQRGLQLPDASRVHQRFRRRNVTAIPSGATSKLGCARMRFAMIDFRFGVALSFGLIACTSPPSVEPADVEAPVGSEPLITAPVEQPGDDLEGSPLGPVSLAPFGGSVWGFVETASASGRIVVLRWFPGEQPPSFGHHGSASVRPTLTAFDLVGGQQRELVELVSVDATRRYIVALADDALWLIDGERGTWEALPDVDLEQDQNPCLWPRQAAFSVDGARLGWVAADAARLNVRELETGARWTVAAKGRLWRAWPDEQGRGAVLVEVPAGSSGWPIQGTSCACRWCNRFARSYSNYGWSGPSFEIVAVAADGSRGEGSPPDSGVALVGPTSSGCTLHASEQDGESLERGPWRWDCADG